MAESAQVGILRALLTADTAQFSKAMEAASKDVQELASKLQKDLEPRQRAVNQAVREFMGGTEIRKAQEYAMAVEKIGGVTKLVESDQRKVNIALREALEHYKRIGVEAPSNLKQLEAATRAAGTAVDGTNKTMSAMWTGIKGAAGLIGVTFGAQAVVNFGAKVFDTASQIKDMSDRLGVSAEAAQRFRFAAEQSGATVDDVERAIATMNRTLAVGDKSTVKALAEAGLQFADIRQMKPEEAFRTIADAVGQIPDPMTRANVAQELFGKGALALLPGMIEGYTKLGESATVMSNETVERLEAAQDAWEAFGNKVTIVSGEMLGAMLRDVEAATNGWSLFLGDLKKTILEGGALGDNMRATRERLMAPARNISPGAAERTEFAPPIPPETIKSVDAYAKSLKALADQLTGRALAAEVQKWSDALERAGGVARITAFEKQKLGKTLVELVNQGAKLPPELQDIWREQEILNFQTKVSTSGLAQFSRSLQDVKLRSAEAEPSLAHLVTQQYELGASLKKNLVGWMSFDQAFAGHIRAQRESAEADASAAKKKDELRQAIDDVARSFEMLANIAGESMGDVVRVVGIGVASIDTFNDSLNRIGKGGFANVASGLSGLLGIGLQLGSMLANINKNVTKEGREDFAESLGFGNLDQLYKDLQRINDEGARLADIGLNVIGKKDEAGNRRWMADVQQFYQISRMSAADLNRVLADTLATGGKLPRAYLPFLEQLIRSGQVSKDVANSLLGIEKLDWKQMKQDILAIGGSIETLGPAWKAAELGEGGEDLLRIWQSLNKPGVDIRNVISDMSDEMSEYVQMMQRAGLEIPADMKPVLQQFVDASELIGENGELITDLTDLNFGQTMAEQMEPMIAALREIVDLLKNDIPNAVNNLPSPPPSSFDYGYGGPPPSDDSGMFPEYATGTRGMFEDFGAFGQLAKLHKREAVVPEDASVGDMSRLLQNWNAANPGEMDRLIAAWNQTPYYDTGLSTQVDSMDRGASPSGATAFEIHNYLNIDGRQVAEANARYTPDVLKRRGLIRR